MDNIIFEQEIKMGKAILLDVRTESEWNEGHAHTAQLFDIARMENGELPQIEKNQQLFVYCRSGGRAGRAKSILEQNGFTNVSNLGGLSDIQEMGLM